MDSPKRAPLDDTAPTGVYTTATECVGGYTFLKRFYIRAIPRISGPHILYYRSCPLGRPLHDFVHATRDSRVYDQCTRIGEIMSGLPSAADKSVLTGSARKIYTSVENKYIYIYDLCERTKYTSDLFIIFLQFRFCFFFYNATDKISY